MTWETYEKIAGTNGDQKRERMLEKTRDRFSRKITESLSYKQAIVNGHKQSIAVINDRNDMSTKKVFAMPGEELPHGSNIEWADSVWLVTEKDTNNEVCQGGKMIRCNYLLKWINDIGDIVERWCFVVDGTKYLIGEHAEQIMSIGDARIAVTIGKDSETVKLKRGARFLIDDEDSECVMAYQITKPNKMFNVFNGKGVYRFILNEVNVTDNDNIDLRIADYYNWHPKNKRDVPDTKLVEPNLDPHQERVEGTPRGWI